MDAEMSLKEWLLSRDGDVLIRLMDGGVSTHLEHLLQEQDPPGAFSHRSLWSSSLLLTEKGRETIISGHKDWLLAGVDILTTVTYQCHYGIPNEPPVLPPTKMTELLKAGVQLAQKTILEHKNSTETSVGPVKKMVVASTGCFGAALADGSEYTGNYRGIGNDGLADFHRKKIKTILKASPDGLAIETLPCVAECAVVCSVLKELEGELPSSCCHWISLACKDGEHLNDGSLFEKALDEIRDSDSEAKIVHGIGINCCDAKYIDSLLACLTKHMALNGPRRGIIVYPNSGEEWDATNETWKEGTGCTDAKDFSDRIMSGVEVVKKIWEEQKGQGPMPKMIVGGCCRTRPNTIAALRHKIDVWNSSMTKPQ